MKRLFSLLLVGIVMLFAGCNKSAEPVVLPELNVTKGEVTESSVAFQIVTKATDVVAYFYSDDLAKVPAADRIIAEGVKVEANKSVDVVLTELEAGVTYTIVVAAQGGGQVISKAIDMTTVEKTPEPEPTPEYLYDEVFASAKRYTSDELGEEVADNHFCMLFRGTAADGGSIMLSLMLIGAEGEDRLSAGTYTIANGGIDCNECEFWVASTDEGYYMNEECEAEVVVEGSVEEGYTFDIGFEDENGNLFKFAYEGEVEGMILPEPEPEPEPEDVVFTVARSEWKGSYHTLTLATADEAVKFVADIYTYNSRFGYLYEGVYTVKNSGYSFAAGEIDYYYSSYTANGAKEILDSGTVQVVINDDLSYKLVVDVVDAAGRELKSEYEGFIEGMSFESGFKWVAAARNVVVGGAEGQFNITFKTAGTDSADSITLDFYAEAGAERLPAGTYPIVSGTEAGVANLDSIVFTTFSQGSPEIDGGEVVVEHRGDNNYKVEFRMTEKDSRRVWVCQYEGEIYNMVIEKGATVLNFVSASGYYSDDSGESYVILKDDSGKQLKLGLIDLSWQSSYITPGVYTVGSSWSQGEIYSGWYGIDWNSSVELKSGSAIFEDNGDATYTITVELTMTNNEAYEGVYVGAIEGYSLPTSGDEGEDENIIELTIEKASGKKYSGTNFGVQLYTPGSNIGAAGNGQEVAYVNLDFYNLVSGIDYIAAGEYVVGGTAAGQIDPAYSKIMMSSSKINAGYANFVINDDKSYTIDFEVTCANGLTYAGSYTGAIENIVVE